MEKIDIVFLGTADIAYTTFEAVLNSDNFNVKALVGQTPKPQGRGNKIIDSKIKTLAIQNNIEVIETLKIAKDESTILRLKEIKPDFFVTFAFGQILSQEVLDIPKCGTINVHPSLLPKYRGSNPIRECLLNGDEKTGISTAMTVLALDEGDIVLQEEIQLNKNTTVTELEDKICKNAPMLLIKTLNGLKKDELTPTKQDGKKATYTKKTTKEDKKICFCESASCIHNKIRALIGQYTCQTTFKGKILKILCSEHIECNENGKIGEVLRVDKEGILVKCQVDAVLLKTVKPEGKGEMTAYSWSLGSKIKAGDCFDD